MSQQRKDNNDNENSEDPENQKDPLIARAGTVLVPGFAEIYLGNIPLGVFWSAIVYVLYVTILSGQFWLFIPGVVIHAFLVYKSEEKVEAYNEGIDPIYPDVDYSKGVEPTEEN